MTAPSVLVIGDLGIDLVMRVPLLPQSDEKITGEKVSQAAGGMSANVAVALARLGTSARLVAAIGDDVFATQVRASLEVNGVDIAFLCPRHNTSTFMCVVMVGADSEKVLVRLPSAAYLPAADELTLAMFEGISHVHLTLGDPSLTKRAIKMAREVSATVSLDLEAADLPLDPNVTAGILQDLDVLFLNKKTRDALNNYLASATIEGLKMVVTTLGREGSRCESNGQVFEQPSYPVKALDTTGAGDAFAGAFLHTYLQDGSLPEALRFASVAASLSIRAYGAQGGLPNRAAVEAYLQHTAY